VRIFLRALVASALLVAACSKPSATKPAPSASVSAARAPASAGASRLGSPTSFELVHGPRSTTLVWAPSHRAGSRLFRLELDQAGGRTGSTAVLFDEGARLGEVTDLAASYVGERLAVAWIERAGERASVRAAWAAEKARVFELGPAFRGPPGARGNVTVAARGDKALVFSRGDEVGCIDPGKHACYAFLFHELAADAAKRTGLPLSVPVPCTDNATSLLVLSDRYHYGVCTDTGRGPVTTVFTLTPEPAYARADPVLEGCEPAGTFLFQGKAWLIANCQGNRRAARIGGSDDEVEYLDLRSPRLDCRGGIAAIRASGFELLLDQPRGRLEALLPSAIAPRGSRAAFTGRALLVASSVGQSLRVARYVCERDQWIESSIDLD
jgi:hypothetical protein